MEYLVIGDPHAKLDNIDKVNKLFDIIEEFKLPVIILGDLLDKKAIIRAECLNLYHQRLKQSDLRFTILVGNHDRLSVTSREHSLEVLNALPNVKIVDDMYTTGNLGFVSYHRDITEFRNKVTDVHASGATTLFCHADIKDFDYGTGKLSDVGADIQDFALFDRVISGHYHKYQKKGNITFLGSPFADSFNDTNQDKFLGIFDTNTQELELLKSPFPQYLTLELVCGESVMPDIDPEDTIRVILTGSEEAVMSHPRLEGIKYIERFDEDGGDDVVVEETLSTEEQFVHWAEDIKGLDDDIIQLGLEILRDV